MDDAIEVEVEVIELCSRERQDCDVASRAARTLSIWVGRGDVDGSAVVRLGVFLDLEDDLWVLLAEPSEESWDTHGGKGVRGVTIDEGDRDAASRSLTLAIGV
jgi:hypothetical protein